MKSAEYVESMCLLTKRESLKEALVHSPALGTCSGAGCVLSKGGEKELDAIRTAGQSSCLPRLIEAEIAESC